MSAFAISLIIWAILVAGALTGAWLRHLLPDHHLDAHAKDIVRLGCALIATIAGLVLGLLINSANTSFNGQRDEIRQMTANVILADQLLSQYGPEARPIRMLLRDAVPSMIDRLWSEGATKTGMTFSAAGGVGDAVYNAVRALKPADDEQRFLQTQSLQL